MIVKAILNGFTKKHVSEILSKKQSGDFGDLETREWTSSIYSLAYICNHIVSNMWSGLCSGERAHPKGN